MHIDHILYFLALSIALLTAAVAGGRWERFIAATILIASIATPLVQTSTFGEVEYGILLVDIALLAALIVAAIRSDRYWPLAAASFQLTGIVVHITRLVGGPVDAEAYGIAVVIWAYLVLAALGIGSAFEVRVKSK
ncbi:hypothetical protein [Sandaracinobacteroides hominis]|uniref:hypothetical protein n=1 Tax=Sandaracinobacteroides hominis TaxID=2780086 RepID=UPI0018F72E51|nr:hypothetical protein [Sandaracinobacteroides hominis]